MTNPRLKFTVADYMNTPDDQRCQLLDGELILAPSPTNKHQTVAGNFFAILRLFVNANRLGRVWIAPFDVALSEHDVVQPDILFVSNQRAAIITEANIQGAPDLVVEVLSPGTAGHDRGYKLDLYSRHGVREYWLVDPDAETVEVLTAGESGLTLHATYRRRQTLASPLLPGLAVDLEEVFSA